MPMAIAQAPILNALAVRPGSFFQFFLQISEIQAQRHTGPQRGGLGGSCWWMSCLGPVLLSSAPPNLCFGTRFILNLCVDV